MTECDSQKMRSLMVTHLGKKGLEEYDEIVKNCKLGKALKDERVWAPLCPKYPNLKGVTCEEIDDFLKDRLTDFFFTETYEDYISDMITDDIVSPEKTPISKEELLGFIKPNISEEEFDKLHRSTIDMDRDMTMFHIEGLKQHGIEEPISPKQLTEDYLHHVRVYDRDEAYEAFKNIGDWIEVDTPGILKDPSTIFVTTPRGGHEMLSIFAYANDIGKEQIPSDITWRHAERNGYNKEPEITFRRYPHAKLYDDTEYDTEIYGKTWLGDISDTVENVFIVDDIIASGSQIEKTTYELMEMFPDAKINSITLCKRSEDSLALETLQPDKYYTDTTTTGIKEFKKLQETGKLDHEYVTCLFPHACPDGDSDKIIIELMGGDRCPPEKRIARRDL